MNTEHEDNLEQSFNSCIVTKNIMVEMRDGTRLSTDIYSLSPLPKHGFKEFKFSTARLAGPAVKIILFLFTISIFFLI